MCVSDVCVSMCVIAHKMSCNKFTFCSGMYHYLSFRHRGQDKMGATLQKIFANSLPCKNFFVFFFKFYLSLFS